MKSCSGVFYASRILGSCISYSYYVMFGYKKENCSLSVEHNFKTHF